MRKLGRLFLILVCLCLSAVCTEELFPRASAEGMAVSEDCVEFIKEVEGFSAHPYYDHKQHTVGYGTKCPTDKYFDYMVNGISREEAEQLLRETLSDIAAAMEEKLMEPYGLTFRQEEFDALASFTFNIGTGWMGYDSSLRAAILNGADEEELVYAFSLYSTAGGVYSKGLIGRRLCEANMYINGVYSKKVSDDYGYVFYEPNGGSLTYQVQGYICENRPAPAADAVRREDTFLGWYTELQGGGKVEQLSKSLRGKTLFARWESSREADGEEEAATAITVTGDVVNIRKGPGTGYGIARQVYRDDVLLLTHVTNLMGQDWGKVLDGWICLQYTNYADVIGDEDDPASEEDTAEDEEQTYPIRGTVRVNDLLRIRSGPGTAYATVGYLFNGNEVEILEQKTASGLDWGRISRGWVCMDYIVTREPEETEPEETEPEETEPETDTESADFAVKITADALRIRSGPGTGHSVVGFYYCDEVVSIREQTRTDGAQWGKTDKGWINLDHVELLSLKDEHLPQEEGRTMTVTADCLRVRKRPDTASKITALLYEGDTVTVFETMPVEDTFWGRCGQGWICMDYVK